MIEFRVNPTNCGAEMKPAVDIAVQFLGMDSSKPYVYLGWNPDNNCFTYLGHMNSHKPICKER